MMDTPPNGEIPGTPQGPRNAESWAKPVQKLVVPEIPGEAMNLNVTGRRTVGPLQGFGQMWQKTYKVRLPGIDVTPQEVIQYWKEHLPNLMPSDSRFYPSLQGVKPGEVVLINATLPVIPGGMPVSTGVLILYADDEMFTVMTPEGHPEAGFNTFSSYLEEGVTVAQIQSQGRANDPIFEFGNRFMGGAKQQERIWHVVLGNLAAHYGVNGQILFQRMLIDPGLQWSQAKNIWYNSIIRTFFYLPVHWAKKLFNRPRK